MGKEGDLNNNVDQGALLPTLTDARAAVLEIPGVTQYLPSKKTPENATGTTEIPLAESEIDAQLDTMVEVVCIHLEGENEIGFIRQYTGWSDAQADAFFAVPKRKPFKSRITFSSDSEAKKGQLVAIGQYLFQRYREGQSPQTQERLRKFHILALNNVFNADAFVYADKYNGIDPKDRHAGTIHPTNEILTLMKDEAREAAKTKGVDAEKLYKEVFAASENGNFATIKMFLENKKGNPALRSAFEQIVIKRAQDQGLAREKLQLLWEQQQFSLAMGVNFATFYKLRNYPDGETIERDIRAYLEDQDSIQPILNYLRSDAPVVFEDWEKSHEPMNYFAIYSERAATHNYSDMVDTPEELEAKKEQEWNSVRDIFPLASVEDEQSEVEAPTQIGAEMRPVNTAYQNTDGKIVNMFFINPRMEGAVRGAAGHELTHKLHRAVLKRAEDCGQIPKGTEVEESIREAFAMLVQRAITPMQKEDIHQALIMRRQGPYAITQRIVRLEMEKLWEQGKRDVLTIEEADNILQTAQPMVDALFQTGISIVSPHQTVAGNVDLVWPHDGLMYMIYILHVVRARQAQKKEQSVVVDGQKQEDTEKAKPKSMQDEFSSEFGPQWLQNKDARAIFLALLVKSGTNRNPETYGDYIAEAKKNIEEPKQLLASLGIDESLI